MTDNRSLTVGFQPAAGVTAWLDTIGSSQVLMPELIGAEGAPPVPKHTDTRAA